MPYFWAIADGNEVNYAKLRSRSQNAVIRVSDAAGNVIETIYHVAGCSNFPSAKTKRTGTCTLASVWGLNRHLMKVLRHDTSKLQSPVVLSIFIDETRPVS